MDFRFTPNDWVRLVREETIIDLRVNQFRGGNIELTPISARAIAAELIRLADEIDGAQVLPVAQETVLPESRQTFGDEPYWMRSGRHG